MLNFNQETHALRYTLETIRLSVNRQCLSHIHSTKMAAKNIFLIDVLFS